MPADRWQRWWFILAAGLFAFAAWFCCDDRLRGLIINSGRISVGVCLISLPLGTFLAFAFLRTNIVGRGWGRWLLPPLLMLPLVIQVAAWETLLGKLGWFTLRSGELAQPLLAGEAAAIWIHALAAVPWVALFVAAGLANVDPAWEEAACLQFAWPLVFWKVALPAILPYVVAAAVWVFVATAGEMTVTNIYMLRTYSEEIYTAFALRESFAAMSWLLLPAALALAAAICVFLAATPPSSNTRTERGPLNAESSVYSWGQGRWLASSLTWFLVALLVAVPAISLASRVGMEVTASHGEQRIRHWSAVKASRVLLQAPQRYAEDSISSLQIAATAAAVGVVGALLLVWWGRELRKNVLPWLILLPLLLPGPLVGLCVIQLLNRPEDPTGWFVWCYDQTILPPVLALLPRVGPVAGLILLATFRSTPRELLDTARLASPSSLGQLLILIRGAHYPSLIAAYLAAFVVAFGDVSCTILVLPPGISTLTFRIFGLLHSGCDDQVAAVCLLFLVGTGVTGTAVTRLVFGRTVQNAEKSKFP